MSERAPRRQSRRRSRRRRHEHTPANPAQTDEGLAYASHRREHGGSQHTNFSVPTVMPSNPVRLQRKRIKGFKLVSPNGRPIVYVGRPTKWGNPFKVGTWWKIGDPKRTIMSRCQAYRPNEPGFTLIESAEQSVKWFRRYLELWPRDLSELRGKDLACWCPLVDKNGNRVPCHADILLDISNS